MMYISQIIMLCTLDLYSDLCQLYLNKTGREKRKKMIMNSFRAETLSYLSFIVNPEQAARC